MTNWLTRPSLSRLQVLILFGGMIYFLYMSTDFFLGLPDLFQFLIYSGVLLLSAFLGYSFIDSKRLAMQVNRKLRNPYKEDTEKISECLDEIDGILFQVKTQIKKQKQNKKKGEK